MFTEATAVEDIGRISNYDAGLWKDEHIPMMKRITDFIHTNHAYAGIQLAHAGRKGTLISSILTNLQDQLVLRL